MREERRVDGGEEGSIVEIKRDLTLGLILDKSSEIGHASLLV